MDILSKEIFTSNDKLKSSILLANSTDRLNTLKDSNTHFTFDEFLHTEKSEYLSSHKQIVTIESRNNLLHKREPIKPSDLREKAFKTSIGVVPLRKSEEFSDLNVVLKGKTLLSSYYPEPPLIPINEQEKFYDKFHANTPLTAFLQERQLILKKPAILPNNGTLSLKPLEKPKKQKVQVSVPRAKTKENTKSAKSAYQSDSQINFSQFDDNDPEINEVKSLIEEAKHFTQTPQKTNDSLYSQNYKSMKGAKSANDNKSSAKIHSSINSHNNEKALLKNVETLIGAIRSGNLIKEQEISDKRIEEILNKVLDRPTINVIEHELSEIEETKSMSKPSIGSVLSNTTTNVYPIDSASEVTSLRTSKMDVKRGTQMFIDNEKHVFTGRGESKIDDNRPDSTENLAKLPSHVTREDITRIDGKQAYLTIVEKEPLIKKQRLNKTFDGEQTKLQRNVHTFCLLNDKTQLLLPQELVDATRKYHVLKKYKSNDVQVNESHVELLQHDTQYELYHKTNEAAKRVLKSLSESTDNSKVKQHENRVSNIEEFTLDGKRVYVEDDYENLILSYLKPSPPKMCLKQSKIKSTLFPEYTSNNLIDAEKENFEYDARDFEQNDEPEDDVNDQINILRQRLINRKYNSDLFLDKLEEPLKMARSYSDSNLAYDKLNELNLMPIDSNYNEAVQEAYNQKEMLKKYDQFIKENGINDPNELNEAEQEMLQSFSNLQSKSLIFSEESKYFPKNKKSTLAEEALKAGRSYIINSKENPKTNTKKYKLDTKIIEEIENFLYNYVGNDLKRSESLSNLRYWKKMEPQFFMSKNIRKRNRQSIPDLLDFDLYKQTNKYDPQRVYGLDADDDPEREWIRGVWNQWFDEVFPLTESEKQLRSDLLNKSRSKKASTETSYGNQQAPKEINEDESSIISSEELNDEDRRHQIEDSGAFKKALHSANIYEKYDKIELTNKTKLDGNLMREIENEINELTKCIEHKLNPFDLCRRGCLFRKLGMLKSALNDLTQVITLETSYIDAYWHRHLIFLAQNKKDQALGDLNTILKLKKNHSGAYLSRGDLCADKFETSLAIVNYSQAIKYDPQNYLAFFKRAQMYETNGEIRMSMDDYLTVTKLNPKISEAWFKHGMNYFNNKNYEYAIYDFTELLKHNPEDSKARLYRGKSHLSLSEYAEAFNDFSTALHLDPNNAEAFYHRGCILRKLDVKQALRDLSISLLIDNSYENVNAYLHRAILYCENGMHEEAIKDYEAVLQLDKLFAPAQVNMGIIYMNVMVNYWKAIKYFSDAIKSNPTYIRAYLCRAKAYHLIHDLKRAYLDYTKAIHLDPMRTQLYICRGQIILEMGDFKLASFCVQHASFLNEDKTLNASIERDQSYAQKAVVFSFLKNYSKAIGVLNTELKSKPNSKTYNLLGRTYMNAKQWHDAVTTFDVSIDYNKINTTHQSKRMHNQAQTTRQLRSLQFSNEGDLIDAYFMKGQSLIELKKYEEATHCFNKVLEMRPKYTQAYFFRGLSKAYMHHTQCIQDFNRALALNPLYFEAYLARATVFGQQKRFAKAILNCNEALKINAKCVRAYLYRGTLKYYNKSYQSAIDDFSETIKYNQKCAIAYYNRAICNHHIMRVADSLRDYSVVLLLGDYLKFNVCINRGLLYYKLGDNSNALHDFHMASHLRPQDIKIKHILGLCYHKLGKLNESIQVLSETIAFNPSYHDAIVSRGNVYVDFGHEHGMRKAKSDYEHVLMRDPTHLNAKINLAYILQMSGQHMKAWRQFSQAIILHPRDTTAYEGRAIVCLQMSDINAALKDINQAIRLAPNPELFVNRGVIHQFAGDNVNAMRDYQAALLIDPHYSLAYFNSANILLLSKQYQQALSNYDKALKQSSTLRDETIYQNRGIVKTILGKHKEALDDFTCALKHNKYSAAVYMNRGLLLYKLKFYQDAEKDFTHAIELTKYDSLLYKLRGDCRAKLKMNDEAMNDFKASISLYDKNFMFSTTA